MMNFGEILLLMFRESLEPENAMKAAFSAYNTNGDGCLDKKELAGVMKFSGTEADAKMMRMAMAMFDDDGKLNYEKFCAMMDAKEVHLNQGPVKTPYTVI